MNIISLTAEFLSWILLNSATGLQTFLEINFHAVANIIAVTKCVANKVQEVLIPALDILYCYITDFVAFSNELATNIYFIGNGMYNVISRIVIHIHSSICTFLNFLNIVYLNLLTLINCVVSCFFQISEDVKYILKLILDAILLILNLGPNSLIFLYEAILLCLKYVYLALYSVIESLLNNSHSLCINCRSMLLNMPPKTYFGIFFIIVLFYTHKSVILFMQSYFTLLLAFLIFLSKKLLNFACTIIYIVFYPLKIVFTKVFFRFNSSLIENWEQPEISITQNTGRVSVRICHLNQSRTEIFFNYLRKMRHTLLKMLFLKRNQTVENQIDHLRRELSAEKDKHLCIVCHDKERNTILFPCRHMCLCDDCSRTIEASFRGCPLCRMNILKVLHVYT